MYYYIKNKNDIYEHTDSFYSFSFLYHVMKKIAIIAPTGMLGSMLYNEYKHKYSLILIYRDASKYKLLTSLYGSTQTSKTIQFDMNTLFQDYIKGFPQSEVSEDMQRLVIEIGDVDYIINCAGIIKPYAAQNSIQTLFINGILPHILSQLYKEKLIHITTDCVFSGITHAPYTEASLHSPTDLYGISKSMGEPQTSLVLRTSIIGPEISGYVSLLEWTKKQKGKEVKGYSNHLWNGLTTKELAKNISKIMDSKSGFLKMGTYHLYSSDISKYEILQKLNEKYHLEMNIQKTETYPIDRRLRSIFPLCKDLGIQDFDAMLREL